jgi:hypothetical protein
MSSRSIHGFLERLGFREGCNVETILSTLNQDTSVNLAPMGVIRAGAKTLEIRPYKTSKTYNNLTPGANACVNVTSDPCLYLQTAFKDHEFIGFHRPKASGLRLKQAEAYIMIMVESVEPLSDLLSKVSCTVQSVETSLIYPRIYSRGRSEAIEAVIHATRVQAYSQQGLDPEVVVRLFNESRSVVMRVSSPDSVEYQVVQALSKLVEGWR